MLYTKRFFLKIKLDAQTRIFYFERHIHVHIETHTNTLTESGFFASFIIFSGADWLTIYVPLASKLNS